MGGKMEERVKELERQIQILQGEVLNLKDRVEDIKPFWEFLQDMEELELRDNAVNVKIQNYDS